VSTTKGGVCWPESWGVELLSVEGAEPVVRAVVTGMIATFPVGGVAWDYGQYALGLERLGFEVWYLEDTGVYSYDPRRGLYTEDFSYGVEFLQDSLASLSPALADRWFVRGFDGTPFGAREVDVPDLVAGADIFLNVSGGCVLREEYLPNRCKILIDTDPGWNHFVVFPRDRVPAGACGFRAHDVFTTYAGLIGRPECALPTFGLEWHPTRPPVVADRWHARPPGECWTTVLSWGNNYGREFEHGGATYGSKEPEFMKIESLPGRVTAKLEVAAGGLEPPVERWRSLGWSVRDSDTVSATLGDYQCYVEGSRGEFSVAKNAYVATGSGWFSCRSACYLAAGRPVVVQDTGFSELLDTGTGLVPFSDLNGAASALTAIERDYDEHSQAARAIAEEQFDAAVVLGELLERAGVAG
jgi:hypothetical protein